MSLKGNALTFGGKSGSGAADLNIDYGETPPSDTSKLWVPLTKNPGNVEVVQSLSANLSNFYSQAFTMFSTSNYVTYPIGYYNGHLYFGGTNISGTSNNFNTKIIKFNLQDGTQTEESIIGSSSSNLKFGQPVLYNNNLYVFYYSSGSFKSRVWIYNLDTDTHESSTISTGVGEDTNYNNYAIVNDKIYFVGSKSGSTYYNSYYCFDTSANSMSNVGSYESVISSNSYDFIQTACTLNGLIYHVPNNPNAKTSNVFCYDPQSMTVTKKASFRDYATYGKTVFPYGGKIYIIIDSNTNMLEYDPISDTIKPFNLAFPFSVSSMYTYAQPVVVGNDIYFTTSTKNLLYRLNMQLALEANKLAIVTSPNTENLWTCINTNTVKVNMFPTNAYLGNTDGQAVETPAYLYRNGAWTALDGSSTTYDMLNALNILEGVT